MAREQPVIVLLRAVNVGGNNKLPMAGLRDALSSVGLKNVRTYIQSGNIVCRSSLAPAKVGTLVESTIESTFALQVPCVALSQEELHEAVAQWPVPQGAAAKTLHIIVFDKPLGTQQIAVVEAAVVASQSTGSEDFAEVRGRLIYLYIPDGMGTSRLARQISNPRMGGTARNWNTANILLEMASSSG